MFSCSSSTALLLQLKASNKYQFFGEFENILAANTTATGRVINAVGTSIYNGKTQNQSEHNCHERYAGQLHPQTAYQ